MIKVYVDSTTYLSYINLSSDIQSLKKFKRLIVTKKLELVITTQTKREFSRNLQDRIDRNLAKLPEEAEQLLVPGEFKNKTKSKYTKEEEEIIKKIEIVNSDLKKLHVRKNEELAKHLKNVEVLIRELFELAILLDDSDQIVNRAIIRYARGLPPQKKDVKFGDSIIWETLKEYLKAESLVIIGSDPDFAETSTEKPTGLKLIRSLKQNGKSTQKKN